MVLFTPLPFLILCSHSTVVEKFIWARHRKPHPNQRESLWKNKVRVNSFSVTSGMTGVYLPETLLLLQTIDMVATEGCHRQAIVQLGEKGCHTREDSGLHMT